MKININDFYKGMRPSVDATKIGTGMYPLLVNGRVRYNAVETIKRSVKQESPAGRLQGIYSLEHFLVVFIDGRIWYRDTRTLDGYVLIPDALLAANVDQIHMIAVPSSTLNFKRKLVGSSIAETELSTTPIATSARGGLAMDGVAQDWVIYPTLNGLAARRSQTFAQWTLTNYSGSALNEFKDTQEYVPVGLFPVWNGQRLFKVAKDPGGSYTVILGSVSGRPLDFVIEISATGDKVAPDRTSHTVAYEPISALYVAPSQDTTFVACTSGRSFGVFSDPSILIFGERFLRTIPIFASGAVSHWGSVDVNGELTFISRRGIIGTAATTQEAATTSSQRVSRNRIFSAPVALLIENTIHAAAVRFDDYALYAMNTVMGNGVLVYDMNLECFVSLDQWEGVGVIRQFAVTFHEGIERLWCYTTDNQLFECFASTETETARLYIGDINTQSAFDNHILGRVAAKFSNVKAPTDVTVDIYRDRILTDRIVRRLHGDAPFLESIIPNDEPRTKTITGFVASTNITSEAFATGALIQWQGDARLTHFAADVAPTESSDQIDAAVPSTQKLVFIADSNRLGQVTLVSDCSSVTTEALGQIITNINKFAPDLIIGGGNHIYEDGTLSDYAAVKTAYAKFGARFIASPGNHDLDTDRGLVFFNYLGDGKRYKSLRVSDLVEIFYLNSGWTTLGASILLSLPPDVEDDGNDVASVQAQWLQSRLALSTARFKLVVIHHPPYSDSATCSPGYARLRWPFRAWGANMVLSGHATSYQRMTIDDIPYIVAGTGGALLTSLLSATYPGFAQDTQFGHGEITVNQYSASWQFVAANGAVLDKVTLRI